MKRHHISMVLGSIAMMGAGMAMASAPEPLDAMSKFQKTSKERMSSPRRSAFRTSIEPGEPHAEKERDKTRHGHHSPADKLKNKRGDPSKAPTVN